METGKQSKSYFGSLDGTEEDTPLISGGSKAATKRTSSPLLQTLLGAAVILVTAILCLSFISFPSRDDVSIATTTSSADVKAGKPVLAKTSKVDSSRPNIVFLLIDDMGYGTIGSDDSDIVFASPYLNSLAKDGIMMTNYYSQEICSPARASLMTGRYPITLGFQYEELGTGAVWGLNSSEVFFPELLREAGYKNYLLGKWNLGHVTPEFLPTARGFDQFVGIMSGQSYQWSKIQPELGLYYDFMKSDTECYEPYLESDKNLYSTYFYRDRALDVISAHDFSDPMFMYLAVQAVHDPFDDNTTYADGFPPEYFPDGVYDQFASVIVGENRLQYALALRILDDAISDVVRALQERGQWDNTYLIVSSDNGGCYQAGGKNGDLRGCKGSLFEGGVKVDSFVYSELLPDTARGTKYGGLFHVSDWFPTILDLVNISYTPDENRQLDGYSQRYAMIGEAENQRDHILYNIYTNIEEKSFPLPVFALRIGKMKILHTYTGSNQALWWNFTKPLADDDDMSSGSCPQTLALRGTFETLLFDLESDPNETTNLYDDERYKAEQLTLLKRVHDFMMVTALDVAPANSDDDAYVYFSAHGNYILPWKEAGSVVFSLATGSRGGQMRTTGRKTTRKQADKKSMGEVIIVNGEEVERISSFPSLCTSKTFFTVSEMTPNDFDQL